MFTWSQTQNKAVRHTVT